MILALLAAASCDLTADPRTYPKFVDTSEDTGNPTGTDTSDTGNGGDDDDDDDDVTSDPVRVNFVGRVATVTGTPFGLDQAAVDVQVSGYFTYDRAVADGNAVDIDRGDFDHRDDTGPFIVGIEAGTTIFVSGSGNPIVVVTTPNQTFQWVDGPQAGDEAFERFCAVDGVEDEDIGIRLTFSPSNADQAFPDDSLPAEFPFTDAAEWDFLTEVDVTFTIEDGDGTLTLELQEVTEPQPQ
jgi:hypothetical protein